jgi:hypothetical protein
MEKILYLDRTQQLVVVEEIQKTLRLTMVLADLVEVVQEHLLPQEELFTQVLRVPLDRVTLVVTVMVMDKLVATNMVLVAVVEVLLLWAVTQQVL